MGVTETWVSEEYSRRETATEAGRGVALLLWLPVPVLAPSLPPSADRMGVEEAKAMKASRSPWSMNKSSPPSHAVASSNSSLVIQESLQDDPVEAVAVVVVIVAAVIL